MKFKIGDKVIISLNSKFYNYGKNNPVDEIGKIVSVTSSNLPIEVHWPSGSNNYNENDLILVEEDRDKIIEVELVVTETSATVFMNNNERILYGDGTFSNIKITNYLKTCIKRKYNKTKKCFVVEDNK